MRPSLRLPTAVRLVSLAARVCLPHLVPHSSIGPGLHPAAPSTHRHCALSSQRLSSDLAASRAPRARVLGLMRLKTHYHAAIPNRVGRLLSRSHRLRMRLRCSPLVCARDLSFLGPSAGTTLGSSCDAITRSPSPAPTQLLTRISATRPQCSGCRQPYHNAADCCQGVGRACPSATAEVCNRH